jgi:hypothetical protein
LKADVCVHIQGEIRVKSRIVCRNEIELLQFS